VQYAAGFFNQNGFKSTPYGFLCWLCCLLLFQLFSSCEGGSSRRRYVEVVRDVAAFLAAADGGGVATPSGGRLSVRGLQALGFAWLGGAGKGL
jgi:hypothetical protein